MVYNVKFVQEGTKYLKVVSLQPVDSTDKELCDLGTEALFIDHHDHAEIQRWVSSTACSDIETGSDGVMEVYMEFAEELQTEIFDACANGELYFSEM